jgi:formylglycine-generating enzyme required for sulfatase activity
VNKHVSLVFLCFLLAGCAGPIPQLGDTQVRAADGMEIIYVPAGTFTMGIDSEMARAARQLCKDYSGDLAFGSCGASAFTNEQPAHPVTLDGFWIDRYEVTNAQYHLCVEDGACAPPVETGSFTREQYYDDPAFDHYPVIHVDWHMASAYCAWAGVALPTEAQWEYSARGLEGLVFPWGNTFKPEKANFCDMHCEGVSDETFDDSFPDTAPVGSFLAGASWTGALDRGFLKL